MMDEKVIKRMAKLLEEKGEGLDEEYKAILEDFVKIQEDSETRASEFSA
jgi:vacuolar-type H+-ATPase subunit D/Vma8